jgi:hypothetical protein
MPNETQVLLKAPETAVRATPWRMEFVKELPAGDGTENDGECVFATQRILLLDSLPVVALVETIGHEVAHLSFPDLCEDAIERFGENVVTALFACPRLKITLAEGADG